MTHIEEDCDFTVVLPSFEGGVAVDRETPSRMSKRVLPHPDSTRVLRGWICCVFTSGIEMCQILIRMNPSSSKDASVARRPCLLIYPRRYTRHAGTTCAEVYRVRRRLWLVCRRFGMIIQSRETACDTNQALRIVRHRLVPVLAVANTPSNADTVSAKLEQMVNESDRSASQKCRYTLMCRIYFQPYARQSLSTARGKFKDGVLSRQMDEPACLARDVPDGGQESLRPYPNLANDDDDDDDDVGHLPPASISDVRLICSSA
nr:hypothetical protein CFP56_00964 [Quercus suber]